MKLAGAAANTAVNAVTGLLDDGYLRIYDGLRPASPETPIAAGLLAELRFGRPAFGPAADGIAKANTIEEVLALSTGRPTWFRALRANGRSPVYDGTVGPRVADLVFPDGEITLGAVVSIQTLTYSQPQE